jgi:glycosyltransferase involved in cell wall biosynthesis
MIERICHIGPALNVQGGISSVLVSYKKLFNLSDEHFLASYNGSFVKSLSTLFFVCFKLLFGSHKRFDFYQIHTSTYGSFFRKFLISLCLRIRKQKYTIHVHGSQFKKFCNESSTILRYCIKTYFNMSSCVICITPDMKEFLITFLKNEKLLFFIVPNPCQTISSMPVDLETHELPVKIVFSGRYGKRKGVYDLINAFDQAHFNVPVKLFLFGDGEENFVRAKVAELTKANDILVSSWLIHQEYLKRLPEFDLLVLPSYAETFGMSLVEAMGFGIPVISSFSGGVPFVVENGKNGLLVQAGDIAGLTVAMEQLVNNKDLRQQMGFRGWERAQSKFTGCVVQKEMKKIYASL